MEETEERDELIESYFRLGLKHYEILLFLTLRHNITISERQLKRILKRLNLWRRKNFSNIDDLMQFLESEIQQSGQLHGFRWMHLKCIQNGFVVTQETVRACLHILDPIGVSFRKRKRLRRRQYYNKGPNYLWHIDSYDKLKPYGICINGCIDGFSRKIVWLKASYSNSDPKIIAGYFMMEIQKLAGCPKTLRTDLGTENRYLEQIQLFFREGSIQEAGSLPPFIYGTSQHNQRIESWWCILRKHNAQFWMNLFEKLKFDNYFHGSFIDKSLIQFCFMDIIQNELDEIFNEWNSHKISRSRNSRAPVGKPIIMYNLPEVYDSVDYCVSVPEDKIEVALEECILVGKFSCDEDVYNACKHLMEENNYATPLTAYDAVDLYINLRNILLHELST